MTQNENINMWKQRRQEINMLLSEAMDFLVKNKDFCKYDFAEGDGNILSLL